MFKFKIVQKLAAFIVAVYHKEAQRLHSVVSEVEQDIKQLEQEREAALVKQLELRDSLVQHKASAAAATEQAVALDTLVGKK